MNIVNSTSGVGPPFAAFPGGTISSRGNLGLGSPCPTAKLNVVGTNTTLTTSNCLSGTTLIDNGSIDNYLPNTNPYFHPKQSNQPQPNFLLNPCQEIYLPANTFTINQNKNMQQYTKVIIFKVKRDKKTNEIVDSEIYGERLVKRTPNMSLEMSTLSELDISSSEIKNLVMKEILTITL